MRTSLLLWGVLLASLVHCARPNFCTPGQSRCPNARQVETCVPSGNYRQLSDCPDGQVCNRGACQPAPPAGCTPGQSKCQGAQKMLCEANGTWSSTTCPEACQAGQCVPQSQACTPACGANEKCESGQCVPQSQACNPPCAANEKCESGQCVPQSQACTPACGANEKCEKGQCVPQSQGCMPACGANEKCESGQCVPQTQGCTPACGANEKCEKGQCVPQNQGCTPACGANEKCENGQCVSTGCGQEGSQRCKDSNAAERCEKDGSWSAQPCAAGSSCRENKCQQDPACKAGETRPCFSGPSGTRDKGECKAGAQTCSPSGVWGLCVGEVAPKAELCNGKDDDCDGKPDENWGRLGQACEAGKGACLKKGTWVCSADGKTTVCDAKAGAPQKEVCNGKDDDCNGQTDDGIWPPCCPAGVPCYRKEGLVHIPTPGAEIKRLTLKPPAGTYTRLLVFVDVKHGGWNGKTSGHRFTTFWIQRNNKFLDLYGYVIFTVPKTLVWRHGLGLSPTAKPKITKTVNFQVGTTYRLAYDYNTKTQTIKLDITTPQGQKIVSLTDKPNVQSIQILTKQTLDLLFSNGTNDPREPPSYKWEYSNVAFGLLK